MRDAAQRLLAALDTHPVLVDVGASGEPPPIWSPIAASSVYLGFDPDLREIQPLSNGQFHTGFLVNEAVTSHVTEAGVRFYLTRSPYCSSTLPPDAASLQNYLFSTLFEVESEATLPATTLDSVLQRLALTRVDWLKVDSQGTDLRLFQSLEATVQSRVLAVDVEPGLIDVYQGEDLFVDTHRALMQAGFWLSNLDVKGAVRMRRDTLARLGSRHEELTQAFVERAIRPSPAWCEARYLRSLEWLAQHHFTPRDYGVLWVFAMLDRQFGFALDLTVQYEQAFGADAISRQMTDETLAALRQLRRRALPLTVARKLLPTRVKHHLKRALSAARQR